MKIRATIVRRIRPGLYLITDPSGRAHQAESMDDWAPGQSVIVLDGQIVARAAAPAKTQQYEV